MKAKLIRVFAPFTRVDDEARTVEGYCFVNELVEGDPYRLTRTAMEAATADYMTWGAVREMHTSAAAGTASDGSGELGVFWDDKGAMLRAKIVDDAAWEKVKAGVYKGFSVGVRPKVVRGKDVESCTWVENSLVDRPADPDAKFTLVRADGATEEIPDEAPALVRGMFAEHVEKYEAGRLRDAAISWLWDCLSEIQWAANDEEIEIDVAAQVREVCSELGEYLVKVMASDPEAIEQAIEKSEQSEITRAEEPERAAEPEIARADSPDAELLTRVQAAETEVQRLSGELKASQTKALELETELNKRKAHKFSIDRTFTANQDRAEGDPEAEALRAEYEELSRAAGGTDSERYDRAVRMQIVRAQLKNLGLSV